MSAFAPGERVVRKMTSVLSELAQERMDCITNVEVASDRNLPVTQRILERRLAELNEEMDLLEKISEALADGRLVITDKKE